MKKIFFFTLLVASFLYGSISQARLIGKFEIPPRNVANPEVPEPTKSSVNSRIADTATTGEIWQEPTTEMTFVWVSSGCFKMGSSRGGNSDEKPEHKVCVDGFWMAKYEVTQGQWRKIMGCNPSRFKKGDNYPVERVSWNDCQIFIEKLKARSDKGFRLPTEAEWEYACRASIRDKKNSAGIVDRLAWYSLNSAGSSHRVGAKAANSFGLFDMVGNVWEWCADWYDEDYYKLSSVRNPEGPSAGVERVFRGGGWNSGVWYLRPANRFHSEPDKRGNELGFRVVFSGRP